MQYMYIHTVDENLVRDDARDAEIQEVLDSWLNETMSSGVNLQGSRLRPTSDATTVRVRRDEVTLTDGPFTETKEQVAGYDIVECPSMEEALAWAAKHPTALIGSIEVRPLYEQVDKAVLPDEKPTTKRYMLIVCVDETIELSPEEIAGIGPATDAWVTEAQGKGMRLFGSRLTGADEARTLRISDGDVIVTDGPFAETKEQIAGIDVFECADLDVALDFAARHPVATFGALEVRPFW